jgi:hypothetical protein
MALPIAATPVLEGEDAERFYRELEANEGKRIPAEELRRGVEIYNAIVTKNTWLGRRPINVPN